MSNIDKRALREIAEEAVGAHERLSVMPPDDIFDISLAEGTQLDADITALNALNSAANPATVLALLDEMEAKDKRIAELEATERQNGYLREQRDEWERKAISNFEDCSEMAARIEELESQRKMAFMAGNRWADKFREAERRITELNGIILSARNFISEYAERGDVGAEEFVSIIDRAAGSAKGELNE